MCLAALAWRVDPTYRLILASNRDERHDRPTQSAHWWPGEPAVFAGRDGVHRGTWCGVSRAGRFGMILSRVTPTGGARPGLGSRGRLVAAWLAGDATRAAFSQALLHHSATYPGFVLLIGEPTGVSVIAGGVGCTASAVTVAPGIHAFSNGSPEVEWPKATWLRQQLRSLAHEQAVRTRLFELLLRREPVADVPPAGHLPKVSLTPFIQGSRYGTRTSTVMVMQASGFCSVRERTFDPDGRTTGETAEDFELKRI